MYRVLASSRLLPFLLLGCCMLARLFLLAGIIASLVLKRPLFALRCPSTLPSLLLLLFLIFLPILAQTVWFWFL